MTVAPEERLDPEIELPLLELFYMLREAQLPLGIQEYELLPRAMMAGFGYDYDDPDALGRLCSLLWIKSPDEQIIFDQIFDDFLARRPLRQKPVEEAAPPEDEIEAPLDLKELEEEPGEQEPPAVEPPPSGPVAGEVVKEPPPAREPADDEFQPRSPKPAPPTAPVSRAPVAPGPKLDPAAHEIEDETSLIPVPRRGLPDDQLLERTYRFSADYLPISKRQMKQSWRYLRKPVREGPPVELDVGATANKVTSGGRLFQLVLRPRRVNRAAMILLLDHDGSMVPFHGFSRRLADTAVRGGRLGQTNVFYFHDAPGDRLYCDPTFSESLTLESLIPNWHPTRTAMLIFSDAGAARSSYNYDRIEMTHAFLRRLRQTVRYVAWLNPVPSSRWAGTSAANIARMAPMFDISRRGLHDAISVLRGRTIPGRGR